MKHILNVSVLVLLLVLTIEAAGINRSLRRIEHEQRRLATHKTAPAWYLMRPPSRYNAWDVTAPLSKWEKIGLYTTETECRAYYIGSIMPLLSASEQAAMAQKHMFYGTSTYSPAEEQSRRCISAADPRLKK
jgi:hypothetical protein